MNGVINIYKPEGLTSFDVVRQVRKICGTSKVGHTGTLDPLASGVLPICIGKGTKLVDYIMEGRKTYKAELKLGQVTDTYDREGKVIRENSYEHISKEVIENVINSFQKEYSQIPPMYSAIKINGKKLYDLARQGIEVERKGRNVVIYKVEILNINKPFVEFRVLCSKGTYIRSLCYDIGETLGCGAYMTKLEREATGTFNIENSINIEDLNRDKLEASLISLEDSLGDYPYIKVSEKFEKLLINGVTIMDKSFYKEKIEENKLYRVHGSNDELIGLGKKLENGFKIIKLLL
ncbi:tRNA pseudouridine(55) synthase TruB [Clostridium hydrogeniformans]|uniref:tRNA pseudouridine(55) synthase TruB n=1 Tax=Clostridium hydrogeniformans TaxID=349933 RepID=UPI0004824373|nr:tRNA pseudouridine(55) synthase TruB [Clostridium hydrogeniformans]